MVTFRSGRHLSKKTQPLGARVTITKHFGDGGLCVTALLLTLHRLRKLQTTPMEIE